MRHLTGWFAGVGAGVTEFVNSASPREPSRKVWAFRNMLSLMWGRMEYFKRCQTAQPWGGWVRPLKSMFWWPTSSQMAGVVRSIGTKHEKERFVLCCKIVGPFYKASERVKKIIRISLSVWKYLARISRSDVKNEGSTLWCQFPSWKNLVLGVKVLLHVVPVLWLDDWFLRLGLTISLFHGSAFCKYHYLVISPLRQNERLEMRNRAALD